MIIIKYIIEVKGIQDLHKTPNDNNLYVRNSQVGIDVFKCNNNVSARMLFWTQVG